MVSSFRRIRSIVPLLALLAVAVFPGLERARRERWYRSRECASGAGFLNYANATALTPSRFRPDDDFHVLTEPG
jgi:hypothetical protein